MALYKPYRVKRTWRERLFSWPWRPWVESKMVEPTVTFDTLLRAPFIVTPLEDTMPAYLRKGNSRISRYGEAPHFPSRLNKRPPVVLNAEDVPLIRNTTLERSQDLSDIDPATKQAIQEIMVRSMTTRHVDIILPDDDQPETPK
jgi:hypothetical protein